MEGVQSHLSGGFSHTLSSDTSNHFPWVNDGSFKSGLDFSTKPVKRALTHLVVLNNVFAAKYLSEIDFEQPGSIVISLHEEVSLVQPEVIYHLKIFHEFLFFVDDVSWTQVGGTSPFVLKFLLGVK